MARGDITQVSKKLTELCGRFPTGQGPPGQLETGRHNAVRYFPARVIPWRVPGRFPGPRNKNAVGCKPPHTCCNPMALGATQSSGARGGPEWHYRTIPWTAGAAPTVPGL